MNEKPLREATFEALTLEHRYDLPWNGAPIPPRWHRCSPWTRGEVNGSLVERCACGAIRYDGYGRWLGRNERRQKV